MLYTCEVLLPLTFPELFRYTQIERQRKMPPYFRSWPDFAHTAHSLISAIFYVPICHPKTLKHPKTMVKLQTF